MRSSLWVTFAFGVAGTARALALEPRAMCFSCCQQPLDFVHFTDMPQGRAPASWGAKISSMLHMSSVAACMVTQCDDVDIEEGWKRLAKLRDLGAPGTPIPTFREAIDSIPNVDAVPIVDCLEAADVSLNKTIRVSQANFDDARRTIVGQCPVTYSHQETFERQMVMHDAFGFVMYLLIFGMTAVGVGNRLLVALSKSAPKTWGRIASGSVLSIWPMAHTWYRRHIGSPAMFGYRHVQPWGILSIPTRLQAIIIFVYVAINVVLGCVDYDTFENNMYWYRRRDLQLIRYVGDRTGIMSFYNLALLWLLAGRNDAVIWLTGWSFQSLNLFHRWAARIATVQALVHSVCYFLLKLGQFWAMMEFRYWATGVYATIAMTLLIPLSLRPVREKMYEAFLIAHIFLSLVLLVTLYLHAEVFGYSSFIWLCAGIWAFDRALRIVRVVVLSFQAANAPNAVGRITAADPGLLRLSVTSSVPLQPQPGDYYFLYSPCSITPWENHPFTLASWNDAPDGTTQLHFLIAPLEGWTGRMHRRLHACEAATEAGGGEKRANHRVLLEGPYGHRCAVEDFDRILLVAGGSGIAAVLPYVFALSRSARKHQVTLVWTARNAAYAVDVLAHELAPGKTSHIKLQLFLTKEPPETARRALLDPEMSVEVFGGRPSMRELLDQEITALPADKRLAVLACGPGAMMDDVRRAATDSYGPWLGQLGSARLEYFEEAFTW